MNILALYKSGIARTLKAWKGILIIWLISFILAGFVAFPLRTGINAFLGSSMITEMFHDSINPEVLANFGPALRTIMVPLFSGIFIIVIVTLFLNAFLSGGIFSVLQTDRNPTVSVFFSGAASNFRGFFIITFFSNLLFLAFIIAGIIIVSIISASESPSEGAVIKAVRNLAVVFTFIIPVILLIADYARSWHSSTEKSSGFSSLGKGFRLTFSNFLFSYLVMFLLVTIQILFIWLAYKIISGFHPESGGGVFLLFILSQVFFIMKIYLRTFRYGTILSYFQVRRAKTIFRPERPDFEI